MYYDLECLKDIARLINEPAAFDRTGHFHSLEGFKVLQPLPQPKDHDFATLCRDRAAELVSSKKRLNVMWSGGADSSLVILLLNEAGIADDMIRVICTADAFYCNPRMEAWLSETYEIDSPLFYPDRLRAFMGEQDRVVSGIGMDMLTRGFEVMSLSSNKLENLTVWLQKQTGGETDEYHAIYEKLAEASGYPCTTVKEYSRLKNLVLCWQPEMVYVGRVSNHGVYDQDFTNFFTTEAFQQWSLANPVDTLALSDRWGNKRMVSDLITAINPDCLPKKNSGPSYDWVNLFTLEKTLKITDDWQYVTK